MGEAKTPPRRGGEEEGEEHHQNPFISTIITHPSTSKIQFRKEVSRACWDEELRMGEVMEKKGSMWATTGIMRAGKLYCHIEEILFLSERGALLLSGSDGTALSIGDIYKKIALGMVGGFSWEAFEVYRHLKSLGYIVGRHGIPWTMKCATIDDVTEDKTTSIMVQQFGGMQLDEVKPTFDVHLPNKKFRKSSPGDPSFLLCLLRENPPSRREVENLEKNCNVIPLKYCFVDHGRVGGRAESSVSKETLRSFIFHVSKRQHPVQARLLRVKTRSALADEGCLECDVYEDQGTVVFYLKI